MNKEIVNNSENIRSKSMSLVDMILILLKWKRPILIFTLIVCIISIILYFFVFDSIYFSTATIKSSGKSASLLMGIEGIADIGGIGDIVGGTSSSKELTYYMEVLSSRRCLEPLIQKFGLMERDNIKFYEDALKIFKNEKLKLEMDKLSGLLYIGVYDKDPVMAKEMDDFLINELNKINIELSVLNAKNNREFIEKRYLQAREDLTKSEDSLKSFQMIYGVAPDIRIKVAAQSVFSLEGELKSEEIKLDVLKKILSADQPEIKTQQAKLDAIRSKIQEMQTSTSQNEILSLGNSPTIALDYLRLQREVEIQTKIVTFMLPIYEQSKIDEKKETPTILILDKPYIAEKKTKPKRLIMVFISTLIAFTIISISILVYELHVKRFILTIKNNK